MSLHFSLYFLLLQNHCWQNWHIPNNICIGVRIWGGQGGIHVQCCRRNSVVIQACHKYLDCLKQSRDYYIYAVIHVKVLSPIDPHGKVSSESWDIQTYSGSSQDSIIHRASWKSILGIRGYSDILRIIPGFHHP